MGFVKFKGGMTGKQAVYIQAICRRLCIETPELDMTKQEATALIRKLKGKNT